MAKSVRVPVASQLPNLSVECCVVCVHIDAVLMHNRTKYRVIPPHLICVQCIGEELIKDESDLVDVVCVEDMTRV